MASETNEVAFPTLDAKDLAALTARGHPREVHAGEVLFEEGETTILVTKIGPRGDVYE